MKMLYFTDQNWSLNLRIRYNSYNVSLLTIAHSARVIILNFKWIAMIYGASISTLALSQNASHKSLFRD